MQATRPRMLVRVLRTGAVIGALLGGALWYLTQPLLRTRAAPVTARVDPDRLAQHVNVLAGELAPQPATFSIGSAAGFDILDPDRARCPGTLDPEDSRS